MPRPVLCLLTLWLLLGSGLGPAVLAQPADGRPPNVIILFTDDQGTLDMGAYGAEDLYTPHLDALAARGVRLTQFYAAAPVCSPSRAGLLTGRYPLRAGVPGNISSQPNHPGMAAEEVTIAEMLKAAGYATAHIGKWHLGYTPETMPNGQGFDHSFGHMGGCIDNYSHFFYWAGPNRHDLWRNGEETFHDGQFFPDLMVAEAERFMTEHRDEPFFIYVALNAPHYPYQGEEAWLRYYADLPYPRNLYAAFLTTLDARIGRLLARVDALGLREHTLILFQSDHGHSVEERAHGGGGWAGPYRGAKFSLFEGGLRVPAIASMPGTLPEGVVRDQLGHGVDWLPTIAEATGVPLLHDDIDGKSLWGMLREDAPSPHEVLYWHVGHGPDAQWAVREGDWKLIGNPHDPTATVPFPEADRLFLVNLRHDVGERQNLAARHPEIVERLRQRYETWRRAAGR